MTRDDLRKLTEMCVCCFENVEIPDELLCQECEETGCDFCDGCEEFHAPDGCNAV